MDVPKATNLHLCNCNISWKFNSRKLFETAYKHEKNSHSNAKEFKLRIHINIDLHWYGSRHATFCKVGQKPPGGNTGVQWDVKMEKLSVSIRFELENLSAHHCLCPNVLLWHSWGRACKGRNQNEKLVFEHKYTSNNDSFIKKSRGEIFDWPFNS